jgi:two-component system, NarL family, response regulator EvgA
VTVLVIDASDAVRARIAARLADDGFEIVGETDDGDVALELVATLRPDAIVLDVLLRERHGLDVLPALRAAAPAARIVILTNAPHYRRRCLELGADLVLDKSADFDAVPAALRAV